MQIVSQGINTSSRTIQTRVAKLTAPIKKYYHKVTFSQTLLGTNTNLTYIVSMLYTIYTSE